MFVYVVCLVGRGMEGGAGHQLRTSGTTLVPHGDVALPSLRDLDSSLDSRHRLVYGWLVTTVLGHEPTSAAGTLNSLVLVFPLCCTGFVGLWAQGMT